MHIKHSAHLKDLHSKCGSICVMTYYISYYTSSVHLPFTTAQLMDISFLDEAFLILTKNYYVCLLISHLLLNFHFYKHK